MAYTVEQFIADCRSTTKEFVQPVDIVLELVPKMQELLKSASSFMRPEHFAGDPEHYQRNAIYISPDNTLSLFAMVWNPGQWTPVHDHGTWGVVGVLKNYLEERAFLRTDTRQAEDNGIVLRRGGITLLSEGSVSTFVPDPDHIHRTGVPKCREQAVSLHLYGRAMSNYHVYDLELGRRTLIDVGHSNLNGENGSLVRADTRRIKSGRGEG